jgi:hypothetical protein
MIDADIGGLARGAVHEWIGTGGVECSREGPSHRSRVGAAWSPPLTILTHLARTALPEGAQAGRSMIAWIGSRVWPHARLAGPRGRWLARHSVFIDPPDDSSRWWAIDLALRAPVFAAVVADGSGARMAQTRRLQLAAARAGGLGLLARPERERGEISAASTRWVVRRRGGAAFEGTVRGRFGESFERAAFHERTEWIGSGAGPRWQIDLIRCRGRWTSVHGRHAGQSWLQRDGWLVELDRDEGVVRVPEGMVDRPAATQAMPARRSMSTRREDVRRPA